jgi:hypothetical protein
MNTVAPPTHDSSMGLEADRRSSPGGVGWLGRSQEQVESKVRQFPVVALATALTAGALLGWLIKRR